MEKSESALELQQLVDKNERSVKIVTPHAMMNVIKDTLAQQNVRVAKV